MYDQYSQGDMTGLPSKSTPVWAQVLILGISAVGLGILFIASPQATLKIIMRFLGLFFLVGGFFSLASIAINSEHWGWKVLAGLAGIIGGLIVMEHPLGSTFLMDAVLVVALAIIGMVMGAAHIVQAFQGAGWGMGILGAIYFIFGFVLLLSPLFAAIALPYVLAVCGIIGGIIAIYYAFRMRRNTKEKST